MQQDPAVREIAEPGRIVTVAVLLMGAMTIMSNATIAPAMPALKHDFAAVPGIDTLAPLMVTLPSVAIVLSSWLFGLLADRWDRQKLLLIAGLLYAVGGTSGLWAQNLAQLLAGRAVLGFGVAGTMTLGLAWASDLWLGPARARFLGLQGASTSAGGIVVMLLGGALAVLHWRAAFAVYALAVPVTALALYALAPYARDRRAAPPAARRGDDGEFPWGVFGFVATLGFLFMAIFYVMPTQVPFHLASLGVTNAFAVGAIMATLTLAAVPGSLFYGQMRRVLSQMAIFSLSWALMGLGMLLVALAQGPGLVVLGSAVAGLGMGPSLPNYTTYLMAHVPPAQRGRASGLLTMSFFGGQFFAPLLSAPLARMFGLAGAFEALALTQLALAAALALNAWQGRRAAA